MAPGGPPQTRWRGSRVFRRARRGRAAAAAAAAAAGLHGPGTEAEAPSRPADIGVPDCLTFARNRATVFTIPIR